MNQGAKQDFPLYCWC